MEQIVNLQNANHTNLYERHVTIEEGFGLSRVEPVASDIVQIDVALACRMIADKFGQLKKRL